MPETLDIQKVISTSTSSVSLDDLNKKGFKQVKVLNQAIISKLIGEAVDRVLSERSKEISKEERDKVIKEAKSQFETLAKKRLEKERSRIDELERANNQLMVELETLRKRFAASVEVQASRDQAVARADALEAEVVRLRKELPELEVSLTKQRLESEHLKSQLASKDEELERVKADTTSNSNVEKLLAAVTERLGSASQGDMSQIMLSLDGLSRRLANISSGGGGGGGLGEADAELTKDFALNALFDKEKEGGIESNVSNVKLKENKAAGVKGALAKLKKLQQGVADGE